MTSETPEPSATYDVVLLVEQTLSERDAGRVHSLHEDAPGQVRYTVLVPVDDAAARVESAMGTLASGDALVAPPMLVDPEMVDELQDELLDEARTGVAASVSALRANGAEAVGVTVTDDPIEALAAKVQEVEAAEVIVLTRPHVVAEFFHLDWSARARRKLGVPVLHLLEHETFDEQAGGGEGVTGM